jgi:hypothetical protein
MQAPQQNLNAELTRALLSILNSQFYAPAQEVPVPRYLLESVNEALVLANKKITTLEGLAGALALAMSEILLAMDPKHPRVIEACAILAKVREVMPQ